MAKPWSLKERTALFAEDVCDFCRRLPGSREAQEVASQLRRAARGVSSNYRAATRGRSDVEFIARIGTVIEEADEAQYWFEHLEVSGVDRSVLASQLRQEANELVAIFVAAHKTAKRKLAEKKRRRKQNRP